MYSIDIVDQYRLNIAFSKQLFHKDMYAEMVLYDKRSDAVVMRINEVGNIKVLNGKQVIELEPNLPGLSEKEKKEREIFLAYGIKQNGDLSYPTMYCNLDGGGELLEVSYKQTKIEKEVFDLVCAMGRKMSQKLFDVEEKLPLLDMRQVVKDYIERYKNGERFEVKVEKKNNKFLEKMEQEQEKSQEQKPLYLGSAYCTKETRGGEELKKPVYSITLDPEKVQQMKADENGYLNLSIVQMKNIQPGRPDCVVVPNTYVESKGQNLAMSLEDMTVSKKDLLDAPRTSYQTKVGTKEQIPLSISPFGKLQVNSYAVLRAQGADTTAPDFKGKLKAEMEKNKNMIHSNCYPVNQENRAAKIEGMRTKKAELKEQGKSTILETKPKFKFVGSAFGKPTEEGEKEFFNITVTRAKMKDLLPDLNGDIHLNIVPIKSLNEHGPNFAVIQQPKNSIEGVRAISVNKDAIMNPKIYEEVSFQSKGETLKASEAHLTLSSRNELVVNASPSVYKNKTEKELADMKVPNADGSKMVNHNLGAVVKNVNGTSKVEMEEKEAPKQIQSEKKEEKPSEKKSRGMKM
jgi:hypothetical protein